ncbi:MAG TPA: 23S rRNA (adenine(2030)-N(6))-methyltransferase RlmJ [Rhizomicrobium sp.]|nr:23S rRNA (adenine(2030)-N(6))-methyltransferase RlmJ [Rhizomicrobium sp.]
MNYRHGYHAGNFADVVKHIALVTVLQHLRKKDTAFSVVDSHGGRGAYDLSGEQSGKTGEARKGVGRLTDLSGDMPDALATYLSLVKDGGLYPGSPLIAARLLRPQDRLIAVEKHPEEFAQLKEILAPFRNAVAEQGDGYGRAVKLVPPPSRRGLVLIDPPFEAPNEFADLARTLRDAYRKFATGIYLAWYPIKSQAEADGFCGEVLAGGMTKAAVTDIAIAAPEGKLSRAGLLAINPPYGYDATMQASAALIAPRLEAVIATRWIAGSA